MLWFYRFCRADRWFFSRYVDYDINSKEQRARGLLDSLLSSLDYELRNRTLLSKTNYLCRVKFFNCWKSTTSTWFTLNVNPKNTKYLLNCANKTSGSPKRPPSQHSGVNKKPHTISKSGRATKVESPRANWREEYQVHVSVINEQIKRIIQVRVINNKLLESLSRFKQK